MFQGFCKQYAATTLSSYSSNGTRTCSQKKLRVRKMTLNFIHIKTVILTVDYSISCAMCCWKDFAREEDDKQECSNVSLVSLYTSTYFAALCN